MKKISLFLVIVLLGCQDVLTPISPSLTDGDTNTLNSNLQTGTSNFQSSLTQDDREYILSNLERSGHSLRAEQLDFLLSVIDASIPVIRSLGDEMPLSLLNTNSEWAEIISQDPEATAFALKVEHAIQDKLATDIQPIAIGCDTGIYVAVFLCLKLQTNSCKWTPDQSCVTLGNLVETIRCIYGMCTVDEP